MVRSLWGALALALVSSLLAAWEAPQSLQAGLWAGSGLALVAGLVAALLLRPSHSQAARVVDLRLDLRQQMGTAEELLSRGAQGQIVSMQIARASTLARDLPIARAFPLVPRRDLLLATVLAAATASMMFLVSLGMTLPNPLSAVHLPSFSQGAAAPADQPAAADGAKGALVPRSPAMEPLRQMMDNLQKQAQQGSLSQVAAGSKLAQANAELNRIAAQSRTQQQALDNLANELQGTAAGRDAAESLRQGNYDQAANQLREAGRQSDQLSDEAKKQLAQALNNAAARSQNAQGLSSNERQAAQGLQNSDYSSTVDSMDQLARSVQSSANQRVSQAELAQAWQQLEQMNQQMGGQNAQGNGQQELSRPVAQASQGGQERSGSPQPGPTGPQDTAAGTPMGAAGQMQGGPPGQGSGQPGNMRGAPPLGNPNPRLGVDGKPQDEQGKLADAFSGEGDPSTQPPSIVRQGTGNSVSSPGSEGANGPVSVPAENVLVPGDRRPIVRDYFSQGSGGQ